MPRTIAPTSSGELPTSSPCCRSRLASPVLGALADYSGRKKFFLIATTLLSVAATALLYWVGPGDIGAAMTLFVLGTFGFEAGYVFYNAFLPDVSTPQTVGRVSGWGWAVGYAGGLLCLLAARPLLEQPLKDALGRISAPGVAAYQLSYLLVAAFYFVFALPAFFWLRESAPQGRLQGWKEYATIGFRRVGRHSVAPAPVPRDGQVHCGFAACSPTASPRW